MSHYIVFALLFGTLVCRGGGMDAGTSLRVRLQHWVPLVLAGAGLPLFPYTSPFAVELMGAAVLVFLWSERRRPHCPLPPGGPFHGRSDPKRHCGAD